MEKDILALPMTHPPERYNIRGVYTAYTVVTETFTFIQHRRSALLKREMNAFLIVVRSHEYSCSLLYFVLYALKIILRVHLPSQWYGSFI